MTAKHTAGSFLAALTLSVALVSSAHAATPVDVSCGETIMADTTLANDLLDCPNNGIVIGADDITLDLNGHTLDGDNELIDPCPKKEFCDFGVVDERHTGVTITGGTVREFGTGVGVFAARKDRLSHLSAVENIFNGILVVQSTRIRVERNMVERNGLTKDYPGLALVDSHDNRIVRNSLSANADLGLFTINADDNLIAKNRLVRNPELGAIIEGDGNEIAGNRIVRNGGGIALTGSRNAITRNRITKSRIAGIGLEGGDDNLVAHNAVHGTGRDGILLGLTFTEHGHDNRVIGNRVRGAGRDGVRVAKKAIDTLLKGNRVSGAGDDGIDVRRAATKLTRNRASHNADLGIEAVRGVINGGGNTASHNGDSAQCTHILCR
jgi:parallel beta-helix repeat protein